MSESHTPALTAELANRIETGLAHQRDGDLATAASLYKEVLTRDPQHVEAHHLMGILARKSGDLQLAEILIGRAIKLKPNLSEAHKNLGNVYRDAENWLQAQASYQRALELKPAFADAYHNLAILYELQGELDAACNNFREAIRRAPRNHKPADSPEPRMVMDQALSALQEARTRLMAAEIPFFLSHGTLLGVVRDGDLLPYDKDMDLGIPPGVEQTAVVAALCDDGCFRETASVSTADTGTVPLIASLYHAASGIALDLFFYQTDGEYFLAGLPKRPAPMLSRPHAFTISTLDWRGLSWPVPSDYERFLVDFYGPHWRTPDPDFDTILSSYCMLPASRPRRRVHGYHRLSTLVQEGKWGKAVAICEQTLKLADDTYLSKLLPALRAQKDADVHGR